MTRQGVRHLVASAFFFSLMSLLVKKAGVRLPSSEIVLARAVVCLVLSWVWLRRIGVPPWGINHRMLLFRGLLGTASLLCYYYALVTLPFAEAVVIQYTSPLFTAALAAVFLGERASWRLVAALCACLAGIIAIARPAALFGSAASSLDAWGLAAAFTCAVTTACVFVLIRRIGDREDPLVVVFYFPLVAVPVVAPLAAASWVWPTPSEWLILLGIGVATQLAQIHMTRGLVLVPAGRASSIGTIQVVLAALWGALFFGEIPDLVALVGAGLILGATLALAVTGFERRAPVPDGMVP